MNKKAQLTLSNPHDVKACKIAPIRRVSFHFTEFHFPEFQSLGLGLYSYTQFEIWCLPIIKFLVQVTSTYYIDYLVSFTLSNISLLLLSYTCFCYRYTKITR